MRTNADDATMKNERRIFAESLNSDKIKLSTKATANGLHTKKNNIHTVIYAFISKAECRFINFFFSKKKHTPYNRRINVNTITFSHSDCMFYETNRMWF